MRAKYDKYFLIFQGNCENRNSKCEKWKPFCRGRYSSWMSKNCKKTCNKCSIKKSKTSGKFFSDLGAVCP